MSSLTLSIEDETLERARVRALEQGTSVTAVLREFLASYAGVDDQRRAIRRFVEIAEGSDAGSASPGRRWSREELYEDRVRWPRS